jgi:tetratricopeptide (TPR) repeat protein
VLASYAYFLWEKRGNLELADSVVARALATDPTNEIALAVYADIVGEGHGDPHRGAQVWREAIAAGADRSLHFEKYAICLQKIGEVRESELMFRRAVSLEPGNARRRVNLAENLFAQRKDAEAIEFVESTIPEVSPDDPLYLSLRFFLVAHDSIRHDSALAELRTALSRVRQPASVTFSDVDRVRVDDPQRLPFVTVLAEAISDRVPIEALDAFDEWRATES